MNSLGSCPYFGEDVGGGTVKFELLLNNHMGELDVETCIADGGHGQWAGRLEVIEPTTVALALEPEAVIFHSSGVSEEFVVHIGHGDAVGEGVGIEYVEAVADSQGGVGGWGA